MISSSLKAIDLFCGSGGMSCGLQMGGAEVIAGIDMEAKYLATFTHNFPLAKSIQADISELSPLELMKKLNLRKGELDFLIGGPPCQGFSKTFLEKIECSRIHAISLSKHFSVIAKLFNHDLSWWKTSQR